MRVDWEVKTEWFVKEKQKGRTRREHAWCKDDGTFYKIKMEQRRQNDQNKNPSKMERCFTRAFQRRKRKGKTTTMKMPEVRL